MFSKNFLCFPKLNPILHTKKLCLKKYFILKAFSITGPGFIMATYSGVSIIWSLIKTVHLLLLLLLLVKECLKCWLERASMFNQNLFNQCPTIRFRCSSLLEDYHQVRRSTTLTINVSENNFLLSSLSRDVRQSQFIWFWCIKMAREQSLVYIYKVVISVYLILVCLFLCPMITHKPLSLSISFKTRTRGNHRNILSF